MTTRDKYTTFNRHSKIIVNQFIECLNGQNYHLEKIKIFLKQRNGYLKVQPILHWC